MRHSCLINGYDELNLTKLDVLDDLPEIQIAVGYEIDGKDLEGFPGRLHFIYTFQFTHRFFLADLEVLARVGVKYITLPGWQTSIANITSFDELPEQCRGYISFIESFLGVNITWIGVGPGRSSMIKKDLDV